MKKKKKKKILGKKKKTGMVSRHPLATPGIFFNLPPPIMHDNEFFSCLRPRIALFRLFLKVAYIICIPNVAYIFCRTDINHHAQPPIIPQHNHSNSDFFFKYIVTSIVLLSIIVPSRHTGIGAWVNSKLYTSILYNLILMQGYCTNTEYTGSLGYN